MGRFRSLGPPEGRICRIHLAWRTHGTPHFPIFCSWICSPVRLPGPWPMDPLAIPISSPDPFEIPRGCSQGFLRMLPGPSGLCREPLPPQSESTKHPLETSRRQIVMTGRKTSRQTIRREETRREEKAPRRDARRSHQYIHFETRRQKASPDKTGRPDETSRRQKASQDKTSR